MLRRFQKLLASVFVVLSVPVLGEREFPSLTVPLMGQKPPGMVAEPFAPGVISTTGWELEGVSLQV